MAGLIGQPYLEPLIRTYRAYFSRPETDPFSGDYTVVLDPYRVDPMNAAAAPTPASVAQQIYAVSQQGDPIARPPGQGVDGGCAWNKYGRGKVEVGGIPLGQRGGAVGYVAAVCVSLVVPTTWWYPHPTCIKADRM